MNKRKTILIIGLTIAIFMLSGCITDLSEADDYDTQTSFGEMHAEDTNVSIAVQNTYYPVGDMNAGHLKGLTSTDGNLTIPTDGNYLLTAQWSFSGGARTEYHISAFKNGTKLQHCHAERMIGTGGDVGSASFTCIEPLNTNDYINMQIENITNTTDPTIHESTITITRISD